MCHFLITATIANAAALATAPAEAAASRTAAMTGPGGCEGFNAAFTGAVAAQIRTSRHAEAGRLMRLDVLCGR